MGSPAMRKFIDLRNYAYDYETPDNRLKFEIVNQSSTSVINCYIEDNYYVSCNAPLRAGYSDIKVRVYDEQNAYDDDVFRVRVSEVEINTNPVISNIPDRKTKQWEKKKTN